MLCRGFFISIIYVHVLFTRSFFLFFLILLILFVRQNLLNLSLFFSTHGCHFFPHLFAVIFYSLTFLIHLFPEISLNLTKLRSLLIVEFQFLDHFFTTLRGISLLSLTITTLCKNCCRTNQDNQKQSYYLLHKLILITKLIFSCL